MNSKFPVFLRFLKDKNLLTQYSRNIKKSYDLIYCGYEWSFISNAFCWASTKERHDFWENLNNEWIEIIQQRKN